jgi:predicted ATPase
MPNQLFDLEFNNFGPIKHAKLDLRPFTVFIGPNNTGKTYVAYFIYSLRDYFMNKVRFYADDSMNESLVTFMDQLYASKDAGIEVFTFTSQWLFEKGHFNNSLNLLAKDFPGFVLGVQGMSFDGSQVSVTPSASTIKRFRDRWMKFEIPRRRFFSDHVTWRKDRNSDTIYFTTDEKRPRKGSSKWNEMLLSTRDIMGTVFSAFFFKDTFALPAERNSLVISYKDIYQSRAEKTFTGTRFPGTLFNEREGEFSRYSLPVINFLKFMYQLPDTPKKTDHFQDIIDYMKQSLLTGGSIVLEKPKDIKIPSIFYEFGSGQRIGIHGASSGVKSLSALILYLERSNPDQILLIDEPEMNLHPRAQLRLVEALTMAVNMGLQVLITTHSPFIVDHLNNLILGSNLTTTYKDKFSEIGIPEQSFISKDSVSVHLFKEDGSTTPILDRETGVIDWSTFSKVAVELEDSYDRLTAIHDS